MHIAVSEEDRRFREEVREWLSANVPKEKLPPLLQDAPPGNFAVFIERGAPEAAAPSSHLKPLASVVSSPRPGVMAYLRDALPPDERRSTASIALSIRFVQTWLSSLPNAVTSGMSQS